MPLAILLTPESVKQKTHVCQMANMSLIESVYKLRSFYMS